jgi:hypothetical protein
VELLPVVGMVAPLLASAVVATESLGVLVAGAVVAGAVVVVGATPPREVSPPMLRHGAPPASPEQACHAADHPT